jgi:phosphatidylinositol glycan class O
MYSQTANKLPGMPELEMLLVDAVHVFKKALEHDNVQDSIAYREACGKFKLFLMEAAELGIRVWTRFDTRGMIIGGAILFLSVILGMPICNLRKSAWRSLPRNHYLEVAVSATLMLFHCVLLTFSNSYIDAEQRIVMFSLAVICMTICWRNATHDDKFGRNAPPVVEAWLPVTVAVLSRVGELFVSGHGQDPSIPLHVSHVPAVFLFALVGLAMIRANVQSLSTLGGGLDIAVLGLLALAWLEKRSSNVGRNGYTFCSIVLVLLTIGITMSVFDLFAIRGKGHATQCISDGIFVLLFRLLAAIMTVTGPSTASSVLLFVIQAHVLYKMSKRTGSLKVSRPIMISRSLYDHISLSLTRPTIFLAGFVSSLGSLVEAYNPPCFLRDEPCLCL